VQAVSLPIISDLGGFAIDLISMDETQIKVLHQDAEEHRKILNCQSSDEFFNVRLPRVSKVTWPPQKSDIA
jgi:hypothetical protein